MNKVDFFSKEHGRLPEGTLPDRLSNLLFIQIQQHYFYHHVSEQFRTHFPAVL